MASPATNYNLKDILINVVSDQDGIVVVSAPHLNKTDIYNVTTGITTLKLSKDVICSHGIENKGILLDVTHDVTVYVVTDGENSVQEGFLLMPLNETKSDVYVVSSYKPSYPSMYLVVALNNYTKVTIQKKQTVLKILTLMAFQTYLFETEDFDPSGRFINANDSVSVLSGSQCSAVLDHTHCQSMAEQLIPMSSWGTKFIVPALLLKPHNVIRIYSGNYPVVVSLHNNTDVTNLNIAAYDYEEIIFEKDVLHVHSLSPVQVVEYSTGYRDGDIGDSFMALVPPVELWMSSYLYKPVHLNYNYTHYLAISSRDQDTTGILVNGVPIGKGVFQQYVYTFEGMYDVTTVVLLEAVEYTIEHKDPSKTFGTLAFGYDMGVAYAFTLGLQSQDETCGSVTQPTSTSTTSAGLTCLYCTGILHADTCNTSVTCQPNQVCYTQRYKDLSQNTILYNSGCATTTCTSTNKRFLLDVSPECEYCCTTNLCNTRCDGAGNITG